MANLAPHVTRDTHGGVAGYINEYKHCLAGERRATMCYSIDLLCF